MESKQIIAIAVIAIVAIAAGGAAFVLMKNPNNNDEKKTDYSILDNPEESVRPGLVLEGKEVIQLTNTTLTETTITKVTEILESGKVKFESHVEGNEPDSVVGVVKDHARDYVPFDFTVNAGELPEGISVSKNNDVYTINGTYSMTVDIYSVSFTYDNFKVTGSFGNETSMEGNITASMEQTIGGNSIKTTSTRTINTATGNLIATNCRAIMEVNGTADSKNDFVKDIFKKYSKDDYSPLTPVKGDKEKVDDVDCDVYVVNGEDNNMDEYKDYKIFVYNGYVVKCNGKINDEPTEKTAKYYYE